MSDGLLRSEKERKRGETERREKRRKRFSAIFGRNGENDRPVKNRLTGF